ncbi:anti-sigma factor [Aquabacter sp. CN5-332]|uniref:anti-sigma factor family protein n=1 Tax=Aquabacter sp. CN5-332 TaxID=3156608 RepID=UPI0032B3C3DC
MNCDDLRELLAPYFDGELAAPEQREVERHLAACPRCAALMAQWGEVRTGLRALEAPRPGAAFAARLGGELASVARPPRVQLAPRALAAGIALLLCGGVVGASLGALGAWGTFSRSVEEDLVVRDVVAAHVRSLLGGTPVDVASADSHTVKPWFAGHLPFAPPIENLIQAGFELVGGRLDYVDGREVAAIVLKRRRHTINLFIWAEAGDDIAPRVLQDRGFTLVSWRRDGLAFWSVSDMEAPELKAFADAAAGTPQNK